MKLTDKIQIPMHAIAKQLGEATVILDLASGNYFGLDFIGARTWQLIAEGKNLKECSDILIEEYDVTRDVLEHDLLNLANRLEANGLISALKP